MIPTEMREAVIRAALEKWRALPDDERNGERPYIMGFNDGWDEAVKAAAEIAVGYAMQGHFGDDWAAGGACAARDIADAIRALADRDECASAWEELPDGKA